MVLLAGCAAPVHYQYNSASYAAWHTFAWKAQAAGVIRNPILDSGILATRVEKAVSAILEGRGYRKVASAGEADFLVTYHTALQRELQSSPSVGFAYGAFWPSVGTVFINQPSARDVQKGSLILDVIDARTKKLVWRGWITRVLEQGNYTQKGVDNAVRRILSKFPPPPRP